MLYDFSKSGQFYPKQIIDDYSYNTLNDKAFAVSGVVTHSFMQSPELTTPRIKSNEIKNIILGGGIKGLINDHIDKSDFFPEIIHNEL
jgi:hypothetical protein